MKAGTKTSKGEVTYNGMKVLEAGPDCVKVQFEFGIPTVPGASAELVYTVEAQGALRVDAVYPVSYTHLDVYKRQGLMGVADTSWVMQRKRMSQTADILLTGRDMDAYSEKNRLLISSVLPRENSPTKARVMWSVRRIFSARSSLA